MSGNSLNNQSERQIRYDNMCHRKNVNQQKMDRTIRQLRRSEMMENVSKEVSNELSSIYIEKSGMVTRNQSITNRR